MSELDRQFKKFNTILLVVNSFMIVFSLLIGEVAGAGVFMGFAGINLIGIFANRFIEDTISFLNKVVNLFGGFKTFQYICIMSDEKIFWLEEFTEGAATGGFFVRNTLKEFIKKLEDDGKKLSA